MNLFTGIIFFENILYKIFNYFNALFRKEYEPGEFITIDERMIKFKGVFRFKVYNPMKPTKVGMKVYACTDAENAYVHSLVLYDGEKRNIRQIIDALTDALCS